MGTSWSQAEINDDIGLYVDGLTFEQEGRKDPPPDAIYRSLLEHCRPAKYLELCHMTTFANDAGDNDGALEIEGQHTYCSDSAGDSGSGEWVMVLRLSRGEPDWRRSGGPVTLIV